jgi:phage shock protein C
VNDRLYRSRDDRIIGGVCAGLAERLDLDPALVRIAWVVLTILTGGILILLYIVMLIVVPEEPGPGEARARDAGQPEPGAVPGWAPPSSSAGWTGPGTSRPGDPTGSAPPSPSTSPEPGTAGAQQSTGPAASTPAPGWVPPEASTAATSGWVPPQSAGYPDTRAERRAARREERRARRASRDPLVGLVIGGLIVLLGLYLLLGQLVPSLDLGRFWPVIVIALGVLLIARAFTSGRPGEP